MTPSPFPAMKPKKFRRLLGVEFGYEPSKNKKRGKGSHRILVSKKGYPKLVDAFSHGGRDVSSIEVRNILVKQVGLTLEEAKEVVKRHG